MTPLECCTLHFHSRRKQQDCGGRADDILRRLQLLFCFSIRLSSKDKKLEFKITNAIIVFPDPTSKYVGQHNPLSVDRVLTLSRTP